MDDKVVRIEGVFGDLNQEVEMVDQDQCHPMDTDQSNVTNNDARSVQSENKNENLVTTTLKVSQRQTGELNETKKQQTHSDNECLSKIKINQKNSSDNEASKIKNSRNNSLIQKAPIHIPKSIKKQKQETICQENTQNFLKQNIIQILYQQGKESNSIHKNYSAQKNYHDIMYEQMDEIILSVDKQAPLFIAMLFLPLKLTIIDYNQTQFSLRYQVECNIDTPQSTIYRILQKEYNNFIVFGFLQDECYEEEEFKEIQVGLLKNYQCCPISISSHKILKSFLIDFFLVFFEIILNNVTNKEYTQVLQYHPDQWKSFKEINKLFANAIIDQLKIVQNANVFVMDHRLFYINSFLAYTFPQITTGIFWNNGFPNWQNFEIIPFKQNFLLSILQANVIIFQDFQHAKNFLSILHCNLGISYGNQKGTLSFLYLGRQIQVRIANLVPEQSLIQTLIKQPEFDIRKQNWIDELSHKLTNKINIHIKQQKQMIVILAIDNLNDLNFVSNNFKLMHQYLVQNYKDKDVQFKIRFIQIIQENSLDDMLINQNQHLQIETIEQLKNHYNQEFNDDIFVTKQRYLSDIERVSLMQLATQASKLIQNYRVYFCSSWIWGIINYFIWIFIIKNSNLNNVLYIELKQLINFQQKYIIFYLQIVLSASATDLSKLNIPSIHFEIFKRNDFSEKLQNIIEQISVSKLFQSHDSLSYSKQLNKYQKKSPINIKSKQQLFQVKKSASKWLDQCVLSLQHSEKILKYAQVSVVQVTGTQVAKVAHRKLSPLISQDHLLENYNKAQNRVFLIDLHGTLIPEKDLTNQMMDSVNQIPTNLVDSLTKLCADPKNTVYIITGNKMEGTIFSEIKNLGLACEYGYTFYDNMDEYNQKTTRPHNILIIEYQKQKTLFHLFEMNHGWKQAIINKMQHFKQLSEGSEVEVKNSTVVWKFGNMNKEFALIQQKELVKQLYICIEQYKDLDIMQGENYVEVRPFGMNKGTISSIIIQKVFMEKKQIDFLMIMGNAISDEEMFVAAKKIQKQKEHYFTNKSASYLCVVGKRPTNATHFVNNYKEVAKVIEILTE